MFQIPGKGLVKGVDKYFISSPTTPCTIIRYVENVKIQYRPKRQVGELGEITNLPQTNFLSKMIPFTFAEN